MDQNPYWFSISPTDLLREDLLITMLCCLCLDDLKKKKRQKVQKQNYKRQSQKDYFTCEETLD